MCWLLAIGCALGSTPAEARNEVQSISLTNLSSDTLIRIQHPLYAGDAFFYPGATAAQVDAALEERFGAGTVQVSGSSVSGGDVARSATTSGTASAPAVLNMGP